MKQFAIIRIIPILAAVALLGGCASSPKNEALLELALLRAVKRNNADRARQLLEAGANPDTLNYKDSTVLMIAADNGYTEIARMLLKAGAKPNIQRPDGMTALMFAAQNDHAEAVKLLLEAGAKPDILMKKDGGGGTALMFAAERGYTDIAKMLLEAWADPNIQRQDGVTALMFAAQNGHMEVVKLLLEAGADPAIRTTKGVVVLTASGYASLNGHSEIVQLLSTTTVKRTELAWQIIAKKYPSLAAEFPTASDYEAWKERCDGKGFANSLIAGKSKAYSENDMFIVEKYGLEIMDMQSAGGGFAYLVGGLGHISGHSRPCYLISATQIPYLAAQGRSMITAPLLLQYIGKDQYREGYQARTCDVFLAFAEGSSEYKDYQNMIDDLQRIEQNPSEYAYILDE